MYKKAFKQAFKDAFRLNKWYFLAVFLLAPLVDLNNIAETYLFKLIVDLVSKSLAGNISQGEAYEKLTILIFLLIIVFVLFNFLARIYYYLAEVWYNRYSKDLKIYVASKIKDLPLQRLEEESVGRLQVKIKNGIDAKLDIIDGVVGEIIPHLFLVIAAIPILFKINFQIALVGISGLPFFVIFRFLMFKKIKTHVIDSKKHAEDAGAIANELFHNIKVIKAFNKTGFQLDLFKRASRMEYQSLVEKSKINTRYTFFSKTASTLPIVAVAGLSGFAALRSTITPGDILLYIGYMSFIYSPLWYISNILDRLGEWLISSYRLDELLNEASEFSGDSKYELKKVKGELEFKDVSFKYEDGRRVLENICFKVGVGETVALVGPSGVGKSTIVKLMLRFRDIENGLIKIDGKDIKRVSKKSLRENIGTVFQDTLLFNNSIVNNIKYGKTNASISAVVNAAKKAKAHGFITNFPKGYHTIIGERGVKLSGGEQQRINIARAVLKNAPILILDEATSHLDSESERLVQEALWKLIEGRTTIIIAHRLATVMRADKILVLDKGKIIEEGNHRELIEKNGLYAKLFKLQSGAMLLTDKEVKV